MSKKCDVAVGDCLPVSFKLIIKNNCIHEPTPPERFTVTTNPRFTLLQTLEEFGNNNPKFRFTTGDVPTSGAYVKSVNGTANGPDKFWHIALYDDGTHAATPINLGYQVCPNDNVYLLYSPF